MRFTSLAAELQSWLKQSIGKGFTPESIEQSMRASGYQADFARGAVAAAFKAIDPPQQPSASAPDGAPLGQPAQAPNAEAGEPESSTRLLAGGPSEIEAGDRSVHILMALNTPRVVLFGNLLAPDEWEALIELSRGKLERSNVVDRATGRYQ